MRNIILSIFLLVVFTSVISGGERIFSKDYELKGKKANLEVESGPYGSDVFLNTGTRRNLSYFTPGENLFPKMFVKKDDYSVTWINYKQNDVKLSFYDSFSEHGRMIVSGNFDFISSDTIVVYNNGKPGFILFRAIKGRDNEDVFIHEIKTGRTVRIAETEGNENTIIIENNELKRRDSFFVRTRTLDYDYTYIINKFDLKVVLKKKQNIPGEIKRDKSAFTSDELNTLIGFGDSITWGKMRMYDLDDFFHPDLTYWAKASQYFNENYGQTYTVNLGVSRDTSLLGLQRMDTDLLYEKGYYFLVLFGTNDVGSGSFSSTSTSENILRILENGRDNYGMYPIVSTVPPQRLYLEGIQFYQAETEKLNRKIIALAVDNNFPYIDSYEAFFEQPEGWEAMLEDIKGNHPSPSGHQVMADLLTPIILDLIPEKPTNVNSSSETGGNSFNVSCSQNIEFDFSHYNVKFGFSSSLLNREVTNSSNDFTVHLYPFNLSQKRTVYFKIQAVDKSGNASTFTKTYSVHLN
ncbi:MAG: SGNH/GDSL hydrolase family protein [Acidobacteriota bacterium]